LKKKKITNKVHPKVNAYLHVKISDVFYAHLREE